MRHEEAHTVAELMLDACFGRPAPAAPGLEPFQAHALQRLRDIIGRRGGALLADSVGLGKTHVAAALIRAELDAGGTALVTAPAQLHAHWKRHLRGLGRASWVSHTALSRGRRVEPATLVVVDEAHAFRNPRTRRYTALALLCEQSRVLLITATPVNNSLLDFYHLVRLFAPRDLFADIGVPDLLAAVESAMRRGTGAELRRVVDAVMVRRTRRALATGSRTGMSTFEGPATTGRGLRFPGTGPIEVLHYDVPPALIECVRRVIPSLSFAAHGLDGDAAPRELMRLGLLKRLESSTWAFHTSVRRHMRLLDHFISAAGDGLLFDPRRDHARDAEVDGAVQLSIRAIVLVPWPRPLDRERLIATAVHDLASLRELDALLIRVGRDAKGHAEGDPEGDSAVDAERDGDAKLSRLLSFLDGIDDKVLLFTEYQDTARALWHALSRRAGTALVHGSDARLGRNRSSRRAVIERFAPIANHARVPRTVERVRLLITTDVLAEGMNLQDASVLVSYDLPWNPVRLAQRIGRIDRLGSPHARIRAVTFVPDRGVDDLLGLMQRIRRKLRHIRLVGGDAPWSLAGRRRAARVIDEIDAAGDARERAYALWRSCSATTSRDEGTDTPVVAVTCYDRGPGGALCCIRAGGETLLVLIPNDGPVQVGTATCWTTLTDVLEAARSNAGDVSAFSEPALSEPPFPAPRIEEREFENPKAAKPQTRKSEIETAAHAAGSAARKALRGKRRQRPLSRSGFDVGIAGAAVLRWLAERPGGPAEEDVAAADRVLHALGSGRRAGTDLRLRDILRNAASADAVIEMLRSDAAAGSYRTFGFPASDGCQEPDVKAKDPFALAGVLLLRPRRPS